MDRDSTLDSNPFMYPQELIILFSLLLGIVFSVAFKIRKTSPNRLPLALAALAQYGVAVYESFMHFIWEKTVHSPIRIDMLYIDIPIMAISSLIGFSTLIWGLRSRSPDR